MLGRQAGTGLQARAPVTGGVQAVPRPASSLPATHVASLSHVFLPDTVRVTTCPGPSPPEILTRPRAGLASLD